MKKKIKVHFLLNEFKIPSIFIDMEISADNLSALEQSAKHRSIQVALLRKSMSIEEQAATQLLETIPQVHIDHNALKGQQDRIMA